MSAHIRQSTELIKYPLLALDHRAEDRKISSNNKQKVAFSLDREDVYVRVVWEGDKLCTWDLLLSACS